MGKRSGTANQIQVKRTYQRGVTYSYRNEAVNQDVKLTLGGRGRKGKEHSPLGVDPSKPRSEKLGFSKPGKIDLNTTREVCMT